MTENKPKILMIEEDYFLRKIYKNRLTRAGFKFYEATNGQEGLSKVLSIRPDIILLDIILPRINGFDVLIEIKSNPQTKNIPVIILSNLSQPKDIERGLSLGAQEYLVKTDVSLSDVTRKAKEWLIRAKQG